MCHKLVRTSQIARKRKWGKDVLRQRIREQVHFCDADLSNDRQGEVWFFNKQNRQPKMVKTKIQNIIIYTRPSSAI